MAGRARSQFRTGLDCHRFFPDPPGNAFAVNFSESFLPVAKCAPEGVRGGWCSAQRIRILMIAGGNHTTIHRLWRAYGTTFSASPVGFFASFLADTRKEGPRQGSGSTWSSENGKSFSSAVPDGGCYFLVSEQESNQRSRLKGRCVSRCRAPKPPP